MLREHFIALAADCDDPEHEVEQLAAQLEDAYMLPFVIFADASGNFLRGQSGAVNPVSFKRTLEELARS